MNNMRTTSFRGKYSAQAIFVILWLLLFTILLPVTASAAPTETEAYSRMIALQKEYPEGREWTNANYYAWKGGIFSGGYGCAGFAFILSDAAFDTLPARMIDEINYNALRVGDILRINGDTHSVIILEKNTNEVVLAEGNYNSSIHWGRIMTKEDVLKADYYMTRYPGRNIAGATVRSIPKQIHTGKAIRPEIKVSDGDKTLTAGTDYSITYKDNKKPGKATVIITGKGIYTGEMEVSFKILPKAISLVSLKSGRSRQLTVKWKKGSGITGYEIQYSLKNNFKNAETITVGRAKTTSLTIPDLKSKKKYYVRIRAYRTVDGENYYSEWSGAMNQKVK